MPASIEIHFIAGRIKGIDINYSNGSSYKPTSTFTQLILRESQSDYSAVRVSVKIDSLNALKHIIIQMVFR